MNRIPSSRLFFGDELDPTLRSSLESMLAGEPSESQVVNSLSRIRRLAPEVPVATGVTASDRQRSGRYHSAIAASILLLVLWSGSASEAWAQIAQNYQDSASIVETPGMNLPSQSSASTVEQPVGAARRFVLIAHVFALMAGLLGMLVAWILSVVNWVSPSRWARHRSRLSKWETRILFLSCTTYAIGIGLGCVWSQATWGRIWGWDPREAFALVTLGIGFLWYCSSAMRPTSGERHPTDVLRSYMAVPSVAFWLIVLAWALSGIYSAKPHLHHYPSMIPNLVVGICAVQLTACYVVRLAIKGTRLS